MISDIFKYNVTSYVNPTRNTVMLFVYQKKRENGSWKQVYVSLNPYNVFVKNGYILPQEYQEIGP